MEVERVKKESSVISPSVIRSSTEFVTLQRSYEAICQERDNLQQQMMNLRATNEREISIQIDNQVKVYREEIKEKDVTLQMHRSEAITLRAEVESLKRDLSNAKDTTVHATKLEQELLNLKTKFAKLQEEYSIVMLAKSKLEEEMVIKVNSGMADKQDYIYKIEKENRELKSENEYYEKTVKEKNTAISDLDLKIRNLQKKVENLKKEIFVAEEAYEKAELRLKEVLKADYKPVTAYELRRYRTSTAESPSTTFNNSASTYTVNKAAFSDADALQFSATSTPMKSALNGERSEVARKTVTTSTGLDRDLARAEGNFQSSKGTFKTTKTVLISDKIEGSTDSGRVGTSYRSTYSSQPSTYRSSSGTSYRTSTGGTSGTGGSGYRASHSSGGCKHSGRYSVTRKFY